jgi:hypothetical protein
MKASEIIKKPFLVVDQFGCVAKIEPDPSGTAWNLYYSVNGHWDFDDSICEKSALRWATGQSMTDKVFLEVEVDKD